MTTVLQLAGAALILAGFVLVQRGSLSPDRLPYLAINAAGAGLLAVLALLSRQWGFVLLEGTWAVVSLIGVGRLLRDRAMGHENAEPPGPASSS